MWLTDKFKEIFGGNGEQKDKKESMIGKVMNKVSMSLDGTNNLISTNRIQSYFLVASVLIMILSIICIEVTNAVIAWNTSKSYSISNEFIIAFGMVLSHHLAILFNRNKPKDVVETNVVETNTASKDESLPKQDTMITETGKPENTGS